MPLVIVVTPLLGLAVMLANGLTKIRDSMFDVQCTQLSTPLDLAHYQVRELDTLARELNTAAAKFRL